MAQNKKALHENLRNKYIEMISEVLKAEGEEVLVTNTNEIAFPCIDEEGNDEWLVLTFKIPTGSRDGDIYDGYGEAESFKMKQNEKREKQKPPQKQRQRKLPRTRQSVKQRQRQRQNTQRKWASNRLFFNLN